MMITLRYAVYIHIFCTGSLQNTFGHMKRSSASYLCYLSSAAQLGATFANMGVLHWGIVLIKREDFGLGFISILVKRELKHFSLESKTKHFYPVYSQNLNNA